MWVAVTERFRRFLSDTLISEAQADDGLTKSCNVVAKLAAHYWDDPAASKGFLVGSWGKKTNIRPPNDVDLLFELPPAVYNRFQQVSGNRQSQLLQEVRGVLLESYPQTTIRGDGQVVVVAFNTVAIDVVPAFELTNGQYYICDTNDGGRYKVADPLAQIRALQDGDNDSSDNLRKVIRMLKVWRRHCNVEMKGFILEIVATQFMAGCPWKNRCFYWYDWIIRDFFIYLVSVTNTMVMIPGTGESYALGDAWRSKAESARDRALKACAHEYYDQVPEAGEEWQKIFGPQIPLKA